MQALLLQISDLGGAVKKAGRRHKNGGMMNKSMYRQYFNFFKFLSSLLYLPVLNAVIDF
jgi:hypothetical protein